MVQADKKSIYAVVGHRDVTDEELITMFTGLESLLNFRLLTYQSLDLRDDVPLTPNHFLHGQMGGKFAPESVETTTKMARGSGHYFTSVGEMAQRMCFCP